MSVYLDNASTTFPKPKKVVDSIYDFLTNIGGNPGRSNHENSITTNRILLDARETISNFFGLSSVENVIFTNNITTSLNVLINGALTNGDHVITSSMEHNSVLRPLESLKNNSIIELDIVMANKFGFINPLDIQKLIKVNTKMVVISHASNVFGSIQNIKEIGRICKEHKLFFILDSAQSAGVLDINFNDLSLNALAFTGHKSLFGPQGTGGFIIDDEFNKACSPLILGGTGSLSYSLIQPDFLPDKFESGTLNMPGIVGLQEGFRFIEKEGLKTIRQKNKFLRDKLVYDMRNISDLLLYDDFDNLDNYTSCISINMEGLDPSELSFILDSDYNIKNRSGLHCAPLAHETLGTFPSGTVRLSLSYFNTKEEIDYTLVALNKISKLK
ncbi:aminotransferase class V-fold PLP-dependent enzyme [Clostridium sp.]|uniref:aminotransferase class V-fold PLP-dependent enzyme n=1 Tax=Clostridium sp. TaxID=1506 RepID=UPI002639B692|nr:aminotransferase class V-fold PLP-dependent enzyme [Clostridium sp.]